MQTHDVTPLPVAAPPPLATTLASLPPAPPGPAAPHPPPGRSVPRLLLEVALIAVGVFLGLLGDQWRERAQHRELARESLRRFRAEFALNRKAVADVRTHHVDGLRDIRAYFRADPAARARLAPPFRSTSPAFLEYTAWDLALATQSLGYVDARLAQEVSRVYAIQRQLDDLTRTATAIMYEKSVDPTAPSFLASMAIYFGDCNLIEPRLLAEYDRVLPRLDRALGEAPGRGAREGAR